MFCFFQTNDHQESMDVWSDFSDTTVYNSQVIGYDL